MSAAPAAVLAAVAEAGRFVDLAGLLESCEVDGATAEFVSWGHYRPHVWRNNRHLHSFHEVCLAYAGRGWFRTGDVEHEVGPGTVFLARPGDVHEIESSGAPGLGIAFWGFVFRPGVESRGWWQGLTGADRPVTSNRAGTLPALVTALAGEAAAPRSGYRATLAALGAALVVETARAFALPEDLAVTPVRRDPGPVALAAMQRLLRDNLARPIGVADVAAAAHLSERHAQRLFHAHTGTTIMATLRRLRLELATQLLLDGSLSITEVARRCGYADVRPFSTAFRRAYGSTPGSFRRSGGTRFL